MKKTEDFLQNRNSLDTPGNQHFMLLAGGDHIVIVGSLLEHKNFKDFPQTVHMLLKSRK